MDTNVKIQSASEIVKSKLDKIIKNKKLSLFFCSNPITVTYGGTCEHCGEDMRGFLAIDGMFVQGANVKLQFYVNYRTLQKLLYGGKTMKKQEKKKTSSFIVNMDKIRDVFKQKGLEVFVSQYPVNMMENCSKCGSKLAGRNIKCFIFHNSKLVLEFYVGEDNF